MFFSVCTGKYCGAIWPSRIPSSIDELLPPPKMLKVLPAMYSGTKNGKPWMWSQCACDSKMLAWPWPRPKGPSSSDIPRLRAPVPQSSTMSRPSDVRSDTHDVLPP
jgi:hypothetical protein